MIFDFLIGFVRFLYFGNSSNKVMIFHKQNCQMNLMMTWCPHYYCERETLSFWIVQFGRHPNYGCQVADESKCTALLNTQFYSHITVIITDLSHKSSEDFILGNLASINMSKYSLYNYDLLMKMHKNFYLDTNKTLQKS